jgi:hypothetical protein
VRILVEQFYLLFTSTLLVETSVLLLPRLHKFSKTLGIIYSNRFFDPSQGTRIRTVGIPSVVGRVRTRSAHSMFRVRPMLWETFLGAGEDGENPSRCRHCERGATLH